MRGVVHYANVLHMMMCGVGMYFVRWGENNQVYYP